MKSIPTGLGNAATTLPSHLRNVLAAEHEEMRVVDGRIAALERELEAMAEQDARGRSISR